METSEEEPATTELSTLLTTTADKKHVQCKLLETIYEDPKCSKDGTEQYTSVRKYKRFIDFNEAPNNAKRWKRTQKAFKLASSRRGAAVVEPCSDISDVTVSSRPTRNCTRHRLPLTYAFGDLVNSSCRKRSSGGQVKVSRSSATACDTGKLHSAAEREYCHAGLTNNCQQDTPVQIVVLENGDVPVEECVTVELPFNECGGSGSRNGVLCTSVAVSYAEGTADATPTEAVNDGANACTASEQRSHFGDSVEEDVRECLRSVLEVIVPEHQESGHSIGKDTDSTSYSPRPRQLPEAHVETQATGTESRTESEVVNAVGDLAAIIETTCFLCEVSSNVADHCADIDCDTIQAAEVVNELVQVISSEQT